MKILLGVGKDKITIESLKVLMNKPDVRKRFIQHAAIFLREYGEIFCFCCFGTSDSQRVLKILHRKLYIWPSPTESFIELLHQQLAENNKTTFNAYNIFFPDTLCRKKENFSPVSLRGVVKVTEIVIEF